MVLKSCTGKPIYISPISLRVTRGWLSEFRLPPGLSLPHIYLPEMKKIESVLCVKFPQVFSNAYDKTELDYYHATQTAAKRQRTVQNNIVRFILS